MSDKFKTINKEISRIKKESDVKTIVAVGSGKEAVTRAQGVDEGSGDDVIDFVSRDKKGTSELKDIDIFIITSEEEKNQLRQIKNVEDVEFDLNYFPLQVAEAMVDKKVQYFLEELVGGKIIYDPEGVGEKLKAEGQKAYDQGPAESTKGNLAYLKYNLEANLKDIAGKNIEDSEAEMEFIFLANMWLKNLLVYYFKLNGMWVPKDKKMFGVIKEKDELLYNKLINFYQEKDPRLLKDIASYVFYEDGIKLGDEMRFKFKF